MPGLQLLPPPPPRLGLKQLVFINVAINVLSTEPAILIENQKNIQLIEIFACFAKITKH